MSEKVTIDVEKLPTGLGIISVAAQTFQCANGVLDSSSFLVFLSSFTTLKAHMLKIAGCNAAKPPCNADRQLMPSQATLATSHL